jgi:hypothetical protein
VGSVFWSSVIGATGVVVGAALGQAVTWVNLKHSRKDHLADLDRARQEHMRDLERELGVKLLVALDHAIAVKGAQDVMRDTEVLRAACEELEIVGSLEVALSARLVAVEWHALSLKLMQAGEVDEAIFHRLGTGSDDLRKRLREAHWSVIGDNKSGGR